MQQLLLISMLRIIQYYLAVIKSTLKVWPRSSAATGKTKSFPPNWITHFTNEYNFTDKRLPVWKVNYPFNHQERLYIETSTGVLAKNTDNVELAEGYSFALFHKHHYMDFGGKTTRDVSTMTGAALQIVMVVIGFVFYFKWRKRKANVKSILHRTLHR